MDVYKILHILVLCCVINEGFAWFGRSSSSSSRSTSKKSSSSSNGRSGSNRRGSGWWGGGRNRPSKPSRPKPRPKPPAPKPKPQPRPADSGKKRGSGWWSGTNRNVPKPKPKPRPLVPKPKPKPKPTDSGKKKSWWSRRKGNVPKPKPKPHPPPPKPKPAQTKPKTNTKPETDMKKVIENYEGIKLKAYDAQPKNKKVHDTTVGIGFNMNRPGAKKTFNKVVPGVDFDKVKSGKKTITKNQARALFNNDVNNIYEPRAKNKIGKDVYDKLPSNVKTAVVNAVYRGDLGPKTAKLIKDGKWKDVGKEYLDHNQYKNADKLGIPGVKTRMDWNKKQFDTMIKP